MRVALGWHGNSFRWIFYTGVARGTAIHPLVSRKGFRYSSGGRIAPGAPRKKMICPQCRSADCFRSHRDGALDFLLSVADLKPWRCHSCDRRFYAWRVAIAFTRFAHCPRCGNFDLERISRERVDNGTLISAKRWLQFSAYRCDPCRERFFSVLRLRRIVPSTVPAYLRRPASF